MAPSFWIHLLQWARNVGYQRKSEAGSGPPNYKLVILESGKSNPHEALEDLFHPHSRTKLRVCCCIICTGKEDLASNCWSPFVRLSRTRACISRARSTGCAWA
eukprot:515265-Amphidinium_carterae.1